MIRRLTNAALGAFFVLGAWHADAALAQQQVDADTYRKGHSQPFYGRDDGLYWHRTYRSPRLIGNGDGYYPIGPTFFEDFTYGDGLGIHCSSVLRPVFFKAAADNTACSTTCGNSACVFGVEVAMADDDDITDCADATVDSCVCMTTPLDRELLGCGANWEAPALGVSLLTMASGVKLAHAALLAQDIGPDMDADGLDIGGDQTEDDGAELLSGMYGASGRPMIPNVDPAFEFCAEVTIEDLSGTDEFWVGWRDTTEPNATFNSYNSYAVVGVDATAGDIHTETEDDGGGTTTTDISLTAWVESEATVFCVLVSDTGAVTYTVDGASASDAVSYTLDAGEPVIPFIHFLHGSDVADEIIVSRWEVSYQ